MAKKPSGLGRGLEDLLADNAPEVRRGAGSVVKRDGEKTVSVTPPPSGMYEIKTKGLYDDLPKFQENRVSEKKK